ncbi:5-formyltetrahydrofolate cyclo-ligase [Actinoplanes palleronii]|uniref:5-formyltetrahydrofolate cyclo-ligase n=1 Tax=Actinoplanes palleronii TaxID=113570 RepID=A0ABQ4BLQ4_9ACTN|nr:5-formyltetrahydrofolate cyclo-ligase [Actinoplanes palleronii]GIE71246.1 5-formyltetrahydrofolate cyclo-ligase [Actinoplanes palleronii]
MPDLAGDAEKSPQNKITLRRHLLTARRSLPDDIRIAAATQLHDQTLTFVRRSAPSTVAAYVPSGSEPGGADLPRLLRGALAPGGRLLLPVLLPDDDLDWAEFTGPLAPGRRGLSEPPGPRLGPDAIRSADLILVPALAVSREGLRLGRGGGSYDRALSRLPDPGPMVIALLHDGETLDVVPAEPHDRPVHGVITPSGGFSPRPA